MTLEIFIVSAYCICLHNVPEAKRILYKYRLPISTVSFKYNRPHPFTCRTSFQYFIRERCLSVSFSTYFLSIFCVYRITIRWCETGDENNLFLSSFYF